MFSSLPNYQRFADMALHRLRKDNEPKPSNRLAGMLCNVLLLVGLWGLPLYARWVVLPDIQRSSGVPASIVGKWRATNGSHFSVAFTLDGQFVLSWKETVIETAHYRFHEGNQNVIVVADFHKQPGDRPVGDVMCWFEVDVSGKRLTTKTSFKLDEDRRRDVQWHGNWKIKDEELRLRSADFERVE